MSAESIHRRSGTWEVELSTPCQRRHALPHRTRVPAVRLPANSEGVIFQVPGATASREPQFDHQDATERAPPLAAVKWMGIASYSAPLSRRPRDFGVDPPHCLKKKSTPARSQRSLMSRTQRSCIGRALGPLSPPTITQEIPSRSISPTGPRSGSMDRKRTATGAPRRCRILAVAI